MILDVGEQVRNDVRNSCAGVNRRLEVPFGMVRRIKVSIGLGPAIQPRVVYAKVIAGP